MEAANEYTYKDRGRGNSSDGGIVSFSRILEIQPADRASASIALLIRIPYVKALVESLDFTFVSVNVALWTVLEPGLGVIAAS